MSCNPPSGSPFTVGQTTVTCTATATSAACSEQSLNSATGTFPIIVAYTPPDPPAPTTIASSLALSVSPSTTVAPGEQITLFAQISADRGDLEGNVSFISDVAAHCGGNPIFNGSTGCVISFSSPGNYGVAATFTSTNGQHESSKESVAITVAVPASSGEECVVDQPCP